MIYVDLGYNCFYLLVLLISLKEFWLPISRAYAGFANISNQFSPLSRSYLNDLFTKRKKKKEPYVLFKRPIKPLTSLFLSLKKINKDLNLVLNSCHSFSTHSHIFFLSLSPLIFLYWFKIQILLTPMRHIYSTRKVIWVERNNRHPLKISIWSSLR